MARPGWLGREGASGPRANFFPYKQGLRLFFLGLGLGLVLGFVLVVYSAGQKYRWLIFVVVPVVT